MLCKTEKLLVTVLTMIYVMTVKSYNCQFFNTNHTSCVFIRILTCSLELYREVVDLSSFIMFPGESNLFVIAQFNFLPSSMFSDYNNVHVQSNYM